MKTVFETIKDRLPIAEVLASYITIEQSGNQYKAKCPFHNERSASFYISSDRGLYYCFGCGAKGDIFTFVEAFEGLDKKGALKLLASRAGVVLTNEKSVHSDTDALYDILEKATAMYQNILASHPEAQTYLHQRGITLDTIEQFRIGYAPDEWRTIQQSCSTDTERALALRAGLTKKTKQGSTEKVYDRFRSRIMFPLCDASGRTIGFSGRLFPQPIDQSNESPKYLNSPETELFQKSRTLFGFDKAKVHIKKNNFAILVEGQMDLVISHQAGFRNTVATSGTAVSLDATTDPFSNLVVLSRLTSHIFLAFDGDSAGQNAMDKAALVALTLGMNPKVVVLPPGTDPADFIKAHGANAWKELLASSKHFVEHHVLLLKEQQLSPHQLVKTIKQKLFPYLANIASPMERELYIKMISEHIGMPVSAIMQELSKTTISQPSQKVSEPILAASQLSGKKASLTSYERLSALYKRYEEPGIQALLTSIHTFAVAEIPFQVPEITDESIPRAIILVEQEYGNLSPSGREHAGKELYEHIIKDFLISLRTTFTDQLKHAEEEGDEYRIEEISKMLHTIHNTMHQNLH